MDRPYAYVAARNGRTGGRKEGPLSLSDSPFIKAAALELAEEPWPPKLSC